VCNGINVLALLRIASSNGEEILIDFKSYNEAKSKKNETLTMKVKISSE